MGYAIFAQISLDRDNLKRPEVDALYREMAGPDDYPSGAYIYINAFLTPEDYFAPYLAQLNTLGVICDVTVFEPRDLVFDPPV